MASIDLNGPLESSDGVHGIGTGSKTMSRHLDPGPSVELLDGINH